MLAVLPVATVSLAYAAKRYYRNNKKNYAATKIQSVFRMYNQKKKFKVLLLINNQIKKYKLDLEAKNNKQNVIEEESDENDYFNFIKKMRKTIKKRGNSRRGKR
jgi:vancomycin permeability regulator SanA|tara:strand:- start:908 stop:1219 length:312 start_codon:yes stop_codon:yes gene_type:complete